MLKNKKIIKSQKYKRNDRNRFEFIGCGHTEKNNNLDRIAHLLTDDNGVGSYLLERWNNRKITGRYVDITREGDNFELTPHSSLQDKAKTIILRGENFERLWYSWRAALKNFDCKELCFGVTLHGSVIFLFKDNNQEKIRAINAILVDWQHFAKMPNILSSLHIKKLSNTTFEITGGNDSQLITLFYFLCHEAVESSFDYGNWSMDFGSGNIINLGRKGDIAYITGNLNDEDDKREQKLSIDNLTLLYDQWKTIKSSKTPFIIFEEDESGLITLRESDM